MDLTTTHYVLLGLLIGIAISNFFFLVDLLQNREDKKLILTQPRLCIITFLSLDDLTLAFTSAFYIVLTYFYHKYLLCHLRRFIQVTSVYILPCIHGTGIVMLSLDLIYRDSSLRGFKTHPCLAPWLCYAVPWLVSCMVIVPLTINHLKCLDSQIFSNPHVKLIAHFFVLLPAITALVLILSFSKQKHFKHPKIEEVKEEEAVEVNHEDHVENLATISGDVALELEEILRVPPPSKFQLLSARSSVIEEEPVVCNEVESLFTIADDSATEQKEQLSDGLTKGLPANKKGVRRRSSAKHLKHSFSKERRLIRNVAICHLLFILPGVCLLLHSILWNNSSVYSESVLYNIQLFVRPMISPYFWFQALRIKYQSYREGRCSSA